MWPFTPEASKGGKRNSPEDKREERGRSDRRKEDGLGGKREVEGVGGRAAGLKRTWRRRSRRRKAGEGMEGEGTFVSVTQVRITKDYKGFTGINRPTRSF